MHKTDWFESWFASPYYPILYKHRDSLEAEGFVEKLINHLMPQPGSRMLDIACGEGRHSIQLADRGFDVTGIDLSQPSIAKAQQSERDNLHFMVHDMRNPFYINYFQFAFNFFTSFGYFGNPRDNQMAAKSFATALRKDGILVLDYLNFEYTAAHLIPEETVEREQVTFYIRRKLEDGYFVKEIRFHDVDGSERIYTERVSAFQLSDFQRIFQNAGLALVNTYGDYKLGHYNAADSPRLILIFKK